MTGASCKWARPLLGSHFLSVFRLISDSRLCGQKEAVEVQSALGRGPSPSAPSLGRRAQRPTLIGRACLAGRGVSGNVRTWAVLRSKQGQGNHRLGPGLRAPRGGGVDVLLPAGLRPLTVPPSVLVRLGHGSPPSHPAHPSPWAGPLPANAPQGTLLPVTRLSLPTTPTPALTAPGAPFRRRPLSRRPPGRTCLTYLQVRFVKRPSPLPETRPVCPLQCPGA